MAEDENKPETTEQPESEGPEDIDIAIEEPEFRSSRGTWFVVVLIIVLAAVAWYLFWAMEQAKKQERQEKQARIEGYRLQEKQIAKGLSDTFSMLDEGDAAGAIKALEKSAKRLSSLAVRAAANEDTDESDLIRLKAQQAKNSLNKINAKQAELVELTRENIISLQRALGLKGVRKAPEEPAPQPAEEVMLKPPAQEMPDEAPTKPLPKPPTGPPAAPQAPEIP